MTELTVALIIAPLAAGSLFVASVPRVLQNAWVACVLAIGLGGMAQWNWLYIGAFVVAVGISIVGAIHATIHATADHFVESSPRSDP